jgi:hypothetical protein
MNKQLFNGYALEVENRTIHILQVEQSLFFFVI